MLLALFNAFNIKYFACPFLHIDYAPCLHISTTLVLSFIAIFCEKYIIYRKEIASIVISINVTFMHNNVVTKWYQKETTMSFVLYFFFPSKIELPIYVRVFLFAMICTKQSIIIAKDGSLTYLFNIIDQSGIFQIIILHWCFNG